MNIICFNCGGISENIYPLCNKCEPKTIKLESSCSICGIETSKFVDICPQCLEKNTLFENNYSLFQYSGLPKEILQQYKFKKDKSFSVFYAKLIIKHIEENFKEPIVICPVPTSILKRKLKNGYQLDDVIKELKKNGIKVCSLLKKRYSKTQKKLNKEERMVNLSNSFVLKKHNKKIELIVLLDDVFTTGATINACAKVLNVKYDLIQSITLYRD